MTMNPTNNAVLTWTWKTQYMFSASSVASNMGSVVASNGWYDDLTTGIVATAVASNGYHFTTWTGFVPGTNNPFVVGITTQALSLVANFAINTQTLQVVSAHGTANPTAGLYTNNWGAVLTNQVSGTETVGGTQYVNTGWTMTGNDPVARTTTSG